MATRAPGREATMIEHRACPTDRGMTNTAIKIGHNVMRTFTAHRTARVMTADAAAHHFIVIEVDCRIPRHGRMTGRTIVGSKNVVGRLG